MVSEVKSKVKNIVSHIYKFYDSAEGYGMYRCTFKKHCKHKKRHCFFLYSQSEGSLAIQVLIIGVNLFRMSEICNFSLFLFKVFLISFY